MPRNKQSLAKRAATLALALCMVFTTAAQGFGDGYNIKKGKEILRS